MRVLIVEDEPLLAMMLADILVDAGHHVVGVASTRAGCSQILDRTTPQLAFVDVRLADGTTGPAIAADLVARQIATVFLTSTPNLLPDDMVGAFGVVSKPYFDTDMRDVLSFLVAATTGGAVPPPPTVLKLSPAMGLGSEGRIRVSIPA